MSRLKRGLKYAWDHPLRAMSALAVIQLIFAGVIYAMFVLPFIEDGDFTAPFTSFGSYPSTSIQDVPASEMMSDGSASGKPQRPPAKTIDEVTGLAWCHSTDDLSSCLPKVCEGGKKKAFIVVGAEWCGWCGKFKSETLADPRITARLKGLGLVYIDSTAAPEAADKVGATNGIPHFLFMDVDCTTKTFSNTGYVNVPILLDMFDDHGM